MCKVRTTIHAQQHPVLKELNEYFGTLFSVTDIWAKKTTINNQYIYFRNHLSLFNDFIAVDEKNGIMRLIRGKEEKVRGLLLKDASIEREKDESVLRGRYIQRLIIFMLFSL